LVIGNETIKKTDVVRQKWLDNYLYGTILSFQYQKSGTQITLGGGWNQYDGGHYGIVKWADKGGFPVDYQYYDNPATKNDLNVYGKIMQSLGAGFKAFIDVQGRFLNYEINGFKSNPDIYLNKKYQFLNPKAGISFSKNSYQIYGSLSIASHEPNRDDFEADIGQVPVPEKLFDWEFGLEKKGSQLNYAATFYYMNYRNQLINTGKINDVGAYTRTNTPLSYRAGIELQAAGMITKWFNASGNISFSKNKISEFTEYIDDYDNGSQKENHFTNTDISFSPNTVAAGSLNFIPILNGEIGLQSKYVSRQFLDNTSNIDRVIPAYFVESLNLRYSLKGAWVKNVDFIFQVNNLFNKKYVANGYGYNFISDGKLNVGNSYFPMAGINFMAAINIKF
jgi:iron complex outermembrane receptor protein